MKLFPSGAIKISILFLVSIIIIGSCTKDNKISNTGSIKGVAFDAISFEQLTGATVRLEPSGGNTEIATKSSILSVVDENGAYYFEQLQSGVYDIYLEMTGYKSMFTMGVDLANGEPFAAFLPVTTSVNTPIGGITGVVVNSAGLPLANANISISAQDELITNGYFSSVVTNEYGQFYIGAVPLETTSVFKVRCIADGYNTEIRTNIDILKNEMINLYFQMEPSTPPAKIFYEGFEGSIENWDITGFWHVRQNANIYNSAYPDYVNIAPNDQSMGRIPDAYKGSRSMWYGNPDTGNFMGEQSPFDYELSGGTSDNKNSGSITSPIINLNNFDKASLNFWSWFEIESVNPNHTGYDLMEIYVIESTGNPILIGKLNPYTDPIISNRKAIPYTSGGFNQAGVWKYQEFNLSEFLGTSIRIKISFDTRDALYNGFRGLFIDEFSVINEGALETKSGRYVPGQLMERSR
jgi:hypothetical protein